MISVIRLADTKFEKEMKAFPQTFRKGAMKGWKKAGRHVRDRARSLIKTGPKTGRKYPTLPNRSSAAGEAPAYQSGNLHRETSYSVRRWNLMIFGGKARYAGYLEYGTKYMRPRPHILTAAMETNRTVKIMLSTYINKELRLNA